MAGRPSIDWIPYQDVKPWVHRLRLGNYKLWLEYVKVNKLPDGIPHNPQLTYTDYISDADFLGHTEYWPYQDAKDFIQRQKIPSYTHWLAWHDVNKPTFVPKYPDQIAGYKHEWESWGEFLGNDNIAHVYRAYRSWIEHLKYAHMLQVGTQGQWTDVNHPKDIHQRPNDYFKGDWKSWDHFLGRNTAERITVRQLQIGVLYIIHENGYPANVLRIGIEANGKAALIDRQQTTGFHLIKVFEYDEELKSEIQNVIQSTTQPWWESDQHFLVSNVHALLYDLQRLLLVV